MGKLCVAILLLAVVVYIQAISVVPNINLRIASLLLTILALLILLWAYATRGSAKKNDPDEK